QARGHLAPAVRPPGRAGRGDLRVLGATGRRSMRATVWGCRGSLASPGPETVRYGGNTSCLEVRLSDDTLLVLDAGTGIRPLGVALGADRPPRIDVLLTHLHIDHLEGLGFFGPLWDPS